jgi:hypothetical protein
MHNTFSNQCPSSVPVKDDVLVEWPINPKRPNPAEPCILEASDATQAGLAGKKAQGLVNCAKVGGRYIPPRFPRVPAEVQLEVLNKVIRFLDG